MHEPLYRWVPPYTESDGDLAANLAEQVGMVMDEDQRRLLDDIFAEAEPGIPAAFEVAILGPRQNIKTSTLEIAALADVFVFGVRQHVWTAHLYSTTQKSFEHMTELIGGCEDLRRRCVWPPRESHGEQAIELLTGERIEFRARSRGAGRGFTGVERITFDEALFLRAVAMGALMPTLATIRGAQIRYGSSGGLLSSDALRLLRRRAYKGGEPRLALTEYGAPRADCAMGEDCPHVAHLVAGKGCALDREDLWAAAGPALGRRITVEIMRDFRRSMPWQEFAREFLTWHEDPPDDEAVEHAIDVQAWRLRRDPSSVPLDPVAIGLDVSPAGVAALAVCGWRRDGRLHGELIASARGTTWVMPLLLRVVAAVDPAVLVLDPASPAGALLPDIRVAGLEARLLTGTERAQADSGLAADVVNDRIRLPGAEMPGLEAAAEAASWREIGKTGAKAFDRMAGGAGISPLVSLSNARFGLLEVAAQPPKPPARMPEPVKSGPALTAGRELDLMSAGF